MRAFLAALLAAAALGRSAGAGPESGRPPLEEASAAYQAGDYARAAALFRRAAERGDRVAQYNLGLIYQEGRGLPRDHAEAVAWFRRAAEQGDPKAQTELGVMLAKGSGAPKDRSAALGWLRKAAQAGDADAALILADLTRGDRPTAAGGPASRHGRLTGLAALAGLVLVGIAAFRFLPAGATAALPRQGETRFSGEPPAPSPPSPGAGTPSPGSGPPTDGTAAVQGPGNPRALAGGKYELRGQIGEGGMGVVFEAFDRVLGRPVAVKVMRPEFKARPAERARFLQEARIISHLTHPYIVGIHDILEEGDETYLVFEFVAGKPLSRVLLEQGRLPLPECVRILDFVCQAVESAHRSRVLHRDLKPANIMLDANGFAKVMDFGLAREAKDSLSRLTQQDSSGTPAYMAPEQHLGRARQASDVYSLAVCLYEMLTGELPFRGPDFLAQKERMKYAPPTFIAPELPKSLDALMAAALAPESDKRVADPLELFERLRVTAS